MQPLTPTQSDLAARYVSLALSLARTHTGDAHDLRSEAQWSLVRAAGEYDPQCGVSFATCVRRHLACDLVDWHRQRKSPKYHPRGGLVSLTEAFSIPDRRSATTTDLVDLGDLLDRLAPEDDELVALLIADHTRTEAAAILGTKSFTVNRRLQKLRPQFTRWLGYGPQRPLSVPHRLEARPFGRAPE